MHSGAEPSPLQLGLPAMDVFPRKLWNRLVGKEIRESGLNSLVYPDTRGYLPLRMAVASYLAISRGVNCATEQVFICAGYGATLDLIFRSLLKKGDQCWFENPGYIMARQFLKEAGVQLIPVPVDADGLNVGAGIRIAPNARIAVVTPSHQSPLGISLSLHRREALIEWANRQRSWIIEDDYDSEYRYQGHPLAALKSIDTQDRVLYTGTFSKVLAPGLRISYLVVPRKLVSRFTNMADIMQNHCPQLLQATVATFIRDGHFARHLRKMRSLYAHRRSLLIDALRSELGENIQIDIKEGGMHLLLRLRNGFQDKQIALNAKKLGFSVLALSAAYLNIKGEQGLLVGFTNVSSEKLAAEWAKSLAIAFVPYHLPR